MFREGGQPAGPALSKGASAMTEGPLGVGVGSFKHDPLRSSVKEHANPVASSGRAAMARSSSGNPFTEVGRLGVCWVHAGAGAWRPCCQAQPAEPACGRKCSMAPPAATPVPCPAAQVSSFNVVKNEICSLNNSMEATPARAGGAGGGEKAAE